MSIMARHVRILCMLHIQSRICPTWRLLQSLWDHCRFADTKRPWRPNLTLSWALQPQLLPMCQRCFCCETNLLKTHWAVKLLRHKLKQSFWLQPAFISNRGRKRRWRRYRARLPPPRLPILHIWRRRSLLGHLAHDGENMQGGATSSRRGAQETCSQKNSSDAQEGSRDVLRLGYKVGIIGEAFAMYHV